MAGILYVMSAGIIAMQWWQGYGSLHTALQWPLTRRTLVGDVFAAIAVELAFPAPLIAVAVAGYLAATGVIAGSAFVSGLAMLLGSLGVAALCYAGCVWVVTVRSVWAVILFVGATYGLGSVLLIPTLMFSTKDAGPAPPTALRIALVGCLACLLAAPLIALAYRRWMRLELGRS
jgi:hypothetical protein